MESLNDPFEIVDSEVAISSIVDKVFVSCWLAVFDLNLANVQGLRKRHLIRFRSRIIVLVKAPYNFPRARALCLELVNASNVYLNKNLPFVHKSLFRVTFAPPGKQ